MIVDEKKGEKFGGVGNNDYLCSGFNKERTDMNTITIDDPRVFMGGELFAKANHSSLKELVNKYVASLAANFYSSKEQEKVEVPLMESEEFKKAMAFMDSFVIEDLASEVPVDEDGKGALARIKYGV